MFSKWIRNEILRIGCDELNLIFPTPTRTGSRWYYPSPIRRDTLHIVHHFNVKYEFIFHRVNRLANYKLFLLLSFCFFRRYVSLVRWDRILYPARLVVLELWRGSIQTQSWQLTNEHKFPKAKWCGKEDFLSPFNGGGGYHISTENHCCSIPLLPFVLVI